MTGPAVRRIDTDVPEVLILEPRVHEDHRGFFMESYSLRTFESVGIRHRFVQDNHSRSLRGVLRGLHYQLHTPQAKLVRVTRGRVFDVAVDIRRGSPRFGRWVGFELTEDNRRMMFAPEGFAHGFLVLSEVAEFQYKCSDFYAPELERGIIWNDPAIAIDWPLQEEPLLSAKDCRWPSLDQAPATDLPLYPGGPA
jgi:dTDP-4-dehydrorhamnose 3,5-epimerase